MYVLENKETLNTKKRDTSHFPGNKKFNGK